MVTPLQHKIYDFICRYIKQHDYSPSLAEIAKGIGISVHSVSLISRSIRALVAEGRLILGEKGYRRVAIPRSGSSDCFSVPLMGRIAAGEPIEALPDEGYLDLSCFMREDHFALQVKGDSMIGEGIFDGDFVILQKANQAAEGEIVVALIDQQEVTLKRVSYQLKGWVSLIPAHPTLKPKLYPPQRVQVQGILVGLVRLSRRKGG